MDHFNSKVISAYWLAKLEGYHQTAEALAALSPTGLEQIQKYDFVLEQQHGAVLRESSNELGGNPIECRKTKSKA